MYEFENMVSFALVTINGDPWCFQDAINGNDSNIWIANIPKEMSYYRKIKLESW